MADTIERVISESGDFFGVACTTTELGERGLQTP